ncbi:hypothetical protein [Bradyrhizobium sp. MOS002]|uniref:hypothetical protein n=1 Tax=Bradyrhizobium sp. MOS002 TaxID=2133947 RepID=UPI001304C583|nr:hypothetical protein [Bradyrhizobium sp. MOS002]
MTFYQWLKCFKRGAIEFARDRHSDTVAELYIDQMDETEQQQPRKKYTNALFAKLPE